MEKNIQEIIESLESQFNGDEKHDLDIVREYLSTLEHTDENLPIVKAVGSYCAEKFPDSEAVKAAKLMEEQFNIFHQKFGDAQRCMQEKRFEEAAALYRDLIGPNPPKPEEGKCRLALNHPFEEMIYRMNYKETGEIERISALPAVIWHQLGMALFELEKYDEAKDAFNSALELNPVNTMPYFELIQIAKIQKNYDEARAILDRIHPYIFTRHQLARFYREHAFLAMTAEKYDLSAALTYISIDYEDAQPSRAMLNSLAKHHADLTKPNFEVAKTRLSADNIPLGPLPAVYETALQIGQQTRKSFPQVAKMAFSIAYDITHYQPILRDIASLG